ncbi:MAG: hypothetical protein ABFE08_17865 [Armatimonadia bacterium]
MALRMFDTLVPLVLPSVPGAPYPLVLKYIREAAIRACETTLLWRHAEPPFVLQPGSYENFFRKPIGTVVHVVFRASCNDQPLARVSFEDALDMYPAWAQRFNGLTPDQLWAGTDPDTLNAEEFNEQLFNGDADINLPPEATEGGGSPRIFTQINPDKYVVLPLPNDEQPYTLKLFYALKPTKVATGMDETILDELEDVVIHGALQHLLVMPKVVWGDPMMASYHAKQYLKTVTERRARANLGNSRATLTVRFNDFA